MVNIPAKNKHITLLRENGFNPFPIPVYPDTEPESKKPDYRYKGARTVLNQEIKDNENYGYLPIKGKGTAIGDLDHKERYRQFAENMIKSGYMVIETGQGWQIPIKGLTGEISKIELFDYDFQPTKKIIEIQGPDHYCIGPGSEIFHNILKKHILYENKGGDKIWDAKGQEFDTIIDSFCKNLKVTGRKKTNRSIYKNMRDRFIDGKLPTSGTSNDFYFQAAIQCNTDKFTQIEAEEQLKENFNKWTESTTYSGRPWSNILDKIEEVYSKDIKIESGRPKGSSKVVDKTIIAQEIIETKKLYSDVDSKELFENNNGFLEKVNNSLQRELLRKYPSLEPSEYNSIIFKLIGLADVMPPTNKNLVVFKNGVYDKVTRCIIETDEIADMGFKEYDYLPPTKENEPLEFIKIMFENLPKEEESRVKRALISVLENHLDPKISVIIGDPGTGKSTILLILVRVMGEYAMAVELDQLLNDKFIRAKINGLRFLVLQDMPENWKDFAKIKALTGEQTKTERGFMQDSVTFENKLKIWGSSNYLAKIPEKEKSAMYSRRLSLNHNTRKVPYPENPHLLDDVVENEGEKIISWILNLKMEEWKYENSAEVRSEWEKEASPELQFIDENYQITNTPPVDDYTVKSVCSDFYNKTSLVMGIKPMKLALEECGFVIKYNVIQNINPFQIKV